MLEPSFCYGSIRISVQSAPSLTAIHNFDCIFLIWTILSGSSLFNHLNSVFFISTTMVNITQYCKMAPHPHEINASNKASTFHLLFPLLSISLRKIDGPGFEKNRRDLVAARFEPSTSDLIHGELDHRTTVSCILIVFVSFSFLVGRAFTDFPRSNKKLSFCNLDTFF